MGANRSAWNRRWNERLHDMAEAEMRRREDELTAQEEARLRAVRDERKYGKGGRNVRA